MQREVRPSSFQRVVEDMRRGQCKTRCQMKLKRDWKWEWDLQDCSYPKLCHSSLQSARCEISDKGSEEEEEETRKTSQEVNTAGHFGDNMVDVISLLCQCVIAYYTQELEGSNLLDLWILQEEFQRWRNDTGLGRVNKYTAIVSHPSVGMMKSGL